MKTARDHNREHYPQDEDGMPLTALQVLNRFFGRVRTIKYEDAKTATARSKLPPRRRAAKKNKAAILGH